MDPFSLQEVYRRINECLTMFHQSQSWNAVKVPAQEMVIIHKVVGKKASQKEKETLVKAEVKLEQIDWNSGFSNNEDVSDENSYKVNGFRKDTALPDDEDEVADGSVKGTKGARKVGNNGVEVRQKKYQVKEELIGIDPNCVISRNRELISNSDHDSNSDNEDHITADELPIDKLSSDDQLEQEQPAQEEQRTLEGEIKRKRKCKKDLESFSGPFGRDCFSAIKINCCRN